MIPAFCYPWGAYRKRGQIYFSPSQNTLFHTLTIFGGWVMRMNFLTTIFARLFIRNFISFLCNPRLGISEARIIIIDRFKGFVKGMRAILKAWRGIG
jgi:hypothetical protein